MMLSIQNLHIRRGASRLHYEFSVRKGEIVAIQGVSGVGKTTLLEAIAGFVEPEQGQILWLNEFISDLPAYKRPVSMLFQDNNLFEHLSVIGNLRLADQAIVLETFTKAASDLDVAQHLNKLPTQCSGGQRQRFGLIRTMLRREPIILLDEPFSELDSQTRQQAVHWTWHKAREQGKTVLLVTHQHEDVAQMADRVIHLT
jgi:thiamine transport system ATP-binding protein